MRVIIIGGGIGGLTAAISLHRRGIHAEVYEQSPEMGEVGAGIGLWPNAIKALKKLGLGESLRSISLGSTDGVLRHWNGPFISRTSAREMERRFGGGVVIVHRAELVGILAECAGVPNIHLNHSFSSAEQNSGGVRAHFTNGAIAVGDALIGADGFRSRLRTQLGHADRIRYAGYTAWRSVVPFELSLITPGETWGPGRRFGAFPLPGNRVYWFATNNSHEGQHYADPRALLLSLFRGWHEPVEALIRAADNSRILHNDIYDLDPLRSWGRGGISLLGDAAHPMTPNLGQGACQAIEDAVVLADCLAGGTNVEDALRKYEISRIARTSRIVMASRRLGALAQYEGTLKCWLRDTLLRLVPNSMTYRGLGPVIGYEDHLI